jgi:hypothetical protein
VRRLSVSMQTPFSAELRSVTEQNIFQHFSIMPTIRISDRCEKIAIRAKIKSSAALKKSSQNENIIYYAQVVTHLCSLVVE